MSGHNEVAAAIRYALWANGIDPAGLDGEIYRLAAEASRRPRGPQVEIEGREIRVTVSRDFAAPILDTPGELAIRLRVKYEEGDARRDADHLPDVLVFQGRIG